MQNKHLFTQKVQLHINDNSIVCRNTITQLQSAVNDIDIFTDSIECVRFLDKITDNKACMIISGSIGQYSKRKKVHSVFIEVRLTNVF
jgi:hypothetical protein